uniref:Uncharacterized protein n=1 Tax=Steinernema glaseri TaxID=37863 RepID=A0A1I7ZCG1_9BILA
MNTLQIGMSHPSHFRSVRAAGLSRVRPGARGARARRRAPPLGRPPQLAPRPGRRRRRWPRVAEAPGRAIDDDGATTPLVNSVR